MNPLGRRSSKRIPIEHLLLSVVASAGIIALAAVAPGLFTAFGPLGRFNKKSYSPYYVQDALTRLAKKGYITFETTPRGRVAVLTNTGKKRLLSYKNPEARKMRERPSRWDGKWRIVMFDVPEKFRLKRHRLRAELKEFGFQKLQGSVWVYPYPCEEFVKLLKADVHFGKSVLYFLTDTLEYDKALKKRFHLSD